MIRPLEKRPFLCPNAAQRENLGEQIETLAASMDALLLEAQPFAAIWSEGGVYNMGFRKGIKA
jgi:hypothetical protein